MLEGNLLNKIENLILTASSKAGEFSSIVQQAKEYILANFGENGLIAAYIALAAVIIFIGTRLAKITISMIKYLVVPAVALAFIGSFFVPYSFLSLLPVTITAGSLILLFKG